MLIKFHGAGTFFGGLVVGIVGILLFEVCVWGAVKLRRRRMQKPAATEEKEGIRFVSMILIPQPNAL